MCNNTDALKQLIDEQLVLDDDLDLTLTGWTDTGDRGEDGVFLNRITTKFGVVCGGINIRQGGFNRGFGFNRDHSEKQPLTIDKIRGVLVTALAVSNTVSGRKVASAFAGVVEKLSQNCFHPVNFDLTIESAEDPTLSLSLSNGLVTVSLVTKPIEIAEKELKLELPVKYVLGRRFANVLLGKSDHGYSSTGLSVLVDGKWSRLTGISSYKFQDDDTIPVDRLEPSQVIGLVSDTRKELVGVALAEIIRQLSTLDGEVHIYQVTAGHNEHRGVPSVVVRLASTLSRKNYSLEFEG